LGYAREDTNLQGRSISVRRRFSPGDWKLLFTTVNNGGGVQDRKREDLQKEIVSTSILGVLSRKKRPGLDYGGSSQEKKKKGYIIGVDKLRGREIG